MEFIAIFALDFIDRKN